MKAEAPARLLLPPRASGLALPKPTRSGGRGASRARADSVTLDAEGLALFEALRAHRLAQARAEGVPPFVVAADRTLREIAATRPQTLAALGTVYGIGPAKAERYGPGLLAVVKTQCP
jgi:ATP-dependent DNA helicase RecQ